MYGTTGQLKSSIGLVQMYTCGTHMSEIRIKYTFKLTGKKQIRIKKISKRRYLTTDQNLAIVCAILTSSSTVIKFLYNLAIVAYSN